MSQLPVLREHDVRNIRGGEHLDELADFRGFFGRGGAAVEPLVHGGLVTHEPREPERMRWPDQDASSESAFVERDLIKVEKSLQLSGRRGRVYRRCPRR